MHNTSSCARASLAAVGCWHHPDNVGLGVCVCVFGANKITVHAYTSNNVRVHLPTHRVRVGVCSTKQQQRHECVCMFLAVRARENRAENSKTRLPAAAAAAGSRRLTIQLADDTIFDLAATVVVVCVVYVCDAPNDRNTSHDATECKIYLYVRFIVQE